MNARRFHNINGGRTYDRITKATAKKMYDNHETFLIAPVNANISSPWNLYYEVGFVEFTTYTFDQFVRNYENYNCVAELGKTCAFYMEV